MASITVFVIAFGVGCLTGVVVGLLSQDRRASGSAHSLLFWVLPCDRWSAGRRPSAGALIAAALLVPIALGVYLMHAMN